MVTLAEGSDNAQGNTKTIKIFKLECTETESQRSTTVHNPPQRNTELQIARQCAAWGAVHPTWPATLASTTVQAKRTTADDKEPMPFHCSSEVNYSHCLSVNDESALSFAGGSADNAWAGRVMVDGCMRSFFLHDPSTVRHSIISAEVALPWPCHSWWCHEFDVPSRLRKPCHPSLTCHRTSRNLRPSRDPGPSPPFAPSSPSPS